MGSIISATSVDMGIEYLGINIGIYVVNYTDRRGIGKTTEV